MKIFSAIKHSVLIAVVLAAVSGCASQPKQQEEAAPQAPTTEQAQAAIAQAQSAIDQAQAAGAEWRDTDALLKQAQDALNAGDTARAIQLANEAQRQAENALAQKQEEEARLAAAKQATAASTYTVNRGDSLWGISGKSDVYGNPYKWPLIYKANRDKIRDADLIYPGQALTIRHDWSDAEANAAIEHARTRGAWSVGKVESSDQAYLAR